MVRSLHHFLNDSDSTLPTSLERSYIVCLASCLFLHTHWQFSGQVWLAHDKTICEYAAAAKLTDCSSMTVKLYNFCTPRALVRGGPDGLFSDLPELFGVKSWQVSCHSWNRGRCSVQPVSRYFVHHCSNCGGPHRAHTCSVHAETSAKIDHTHWLPSPLVSSSNAWRASGQHIWPFVISYI